MAPQTSVTIVGAGLASLTLACLLEQAGTPYVILESNDQVQTTGGSVTLHPTVLPLLDQLGFQSDLNFISQPLLEIMILSNQHQEIGTIDYSSREERYGNFSKVMSRAELLEILLSRIPEHKVLYNKRVVQVQEFHSTSTTTTSSSSRSETTDGGVGAPTRAQSTSVFGRGHHKHHHHHQQQQQDSAGHHHSSSITTTTMADDSLGGHKTQDDHCSLENKTKVNNEGILPDDDNDTSYHHHTSSSGSMYMYIDEALENDGAACSSSSSRPTHNPPQESIGVRCFCDDGSIYSSDIVVGCDGASSRVRQCLYRDLARQNLLPAQDLEPRKVVQQCIAGIAVDLDPQRFPLLKEFTTQFRVVLADDRSYSWCAVSLVDDRIAWQVNKKVVPLSSSSAAAVASSSSTSSSKGASSKKASASTRVSFAESSTVAPRSSFSKEKQNAATNPININTTTRAETASTISSSHSTAAATIRSTYTSNSSASTVDMVESSSSSRDHHALQPLQEHSTENNNNNNNNNNSNDVESENESSWKSISDPLHTELGQLMSNLMCPFGRTMSELYENTPQETISVVNVENRPYETWYHGRVVLCGDACHASVPIAGLGSDPAIQDAVSIANHLFHLFSPSTTPPTVQDITNVFSSYYKERCPAAIMTDQESKYLDRLYHESGWMADLYRSICLNYIPEFMKRWHEDKLFRDRRQANYLQPARDVGTLKPKPRPVVPRLVKGDR